MPNGDLIAGGRFTTAGGVPANYIARWDGVAWSPLGSGCEGFQNPFVHALTVLPNGDLVVGGNFTSAGGVVVNRIARWNGAVWAPLGTGMNQSVSALAVLPNGDLVAGGAFTTAGGVSVNRVARWDGEVWSPLGSGTGQNGFVFDLEVLPNGDLVAGGTFTAAGGVNANYVARWNGAAWSPLGAGIEGMHNGYVNTLAILSTGELAMGGTFMVADGQPSAYFARYRFECPLPCDPDFNCDGNADQDDVGCIINVVAGNPGCECQDPDFNRDGNVDQDDVAALINVVAGAGCP
jgi:hypothetical protein